MSPASTRPNTNTSLGHASSLSIKSHSALIVAVYQSEKLRPLSTLQNSQISQHARKLAHKHMVSRECSYMSVFFEAKLKYMVHCSLGRTRGQLSQACPGARLLLHSSSKSPSSASQQPSGAWGSPRGAKRVTARFAPPHPERRRQESHRRPVCGCTTEVEDFNLPRRPWPRPSSQPRLKPPR